eukprot:964217-Prorocentrum_minimum.AAC.2
MHVEDVAEDPLVPSSATKGGGNSGAGGSGVKPNQPSSPAGGAGTLAVSNPRSLSRPGSSTTALVSRDPRVHPESAIVTIPPQNFIDEKALANQPRPPKSCFSRNKWKIAVGLTVFNVAVVAAIIATSGGGGGSPGPLYWTQSPTTSSPTVPVRDPENVQPVKV